MHRSHAIHTLCALVLCCTLAMGMPAHAQTAMPPMGEAAVRGEDVKVQVLACAFEETARSLKDFEKSKDYYARMGGRSLKAKLSALMAALEPLQAKLPENRFSPEQERAALRVLQADPGLAPYGGQVEALWSAGKLSSPLAVKRIAQIVDPSLVPALSRRDSVADETPEETGSLPAWAPAAIAVGVILFLVVVVLVRKKTSAPPELPPVQPRPVQASRVEEEEDGEASVKAETTEISNDYRIPRDKGSYAMSEDLPLGERGQVSLPTRREISGRHQMVVMLQDGKVIQRVNLTKAVVSFGRVGDSSCGRADIALDLSMLQDEDRKAISRVHGVLAYHEYAGGGQWLLAVNQGSERNPGPDKVRTITCINEKHQVKKGVAFMVHGDDVFVLSPKISIKIISK